MTVTPNILAYLALFGWPILAIVLYRRLPLPAALVWSILAPYLILPEGLMIDFPILPGFDKQSIPALCALVLVSAAAARRVSRRSQAETAPTDPPAPSDASPRAPLRGRSRPALLFTILVTLTVAAPIATNLLNTDSLMIGPRFIQGTGIKEVYGNVLMTLLGLVPFMLARRHLARPEDQLMLMRALIASCLAYTLLMLIEIRISPQLHRLLYGYHPHSFAQHIRGGQYRPMVFLEHGLRVGLFVAMAALCCATMWRIVRQAVQSPGAARQARGASRPEATTASAAAPIASQVTSVRARPGSRNEPGEPVLRAPRYWAIRLVWISIVLVLSRNLGATMIVILLLPAILFLGIRWQLLIAATFAALILIYPMARGAGMVPTERILSLAYAIDEDRGRSLDFRLMNEDMLLDRANEKPLFGWGDWGRSRVYDPRSGDDLSITDGTWVILIGSSGWIGYLTKFGLLTAPILLMLRRAKVADQAAAGLTLVLAANLIDLIPNSGLTPITWLIAGSLAGRVEQLANAAPAAVRQRVRPSAEMPPQQGTAVARTRGNPPAAGAARTSARGT